MIIIMEEKYSMNCVYVVIIVWMFSTIYNIITELMKIIIVYVLLMKHVIVELHDFVLE